MIAKTAMVNLIIFILDRNVANDSHETINSTYTSADEARNVIPKIHIFLRSFIPNSIVIKKINTHIAHGLNPSVSPKTIARIGNDTLFAEIWPRIGTL